MTAAVGLQSLWTAPCCSYVGGLHFVFGGNLYAWLGKLDSSKCCKVLKKSSILNQCHLALLLFLRPPPALHNGAAQQAGEHHGDGGPLLRQQRRAEP